MQPPAKSVLVLLAISVSRRDPSGRHMEEAHLTEGLVMGLQKMVLYWGRAWYDHLEKLCR